MIYELVGLDRCKTCKHYIKGLRCEAYRTIPHSILMGKNDHSKPLAEHTETYYEEDYNYPSDNDIVYDAKE